MIEVIHNHIVNEFPGRTVKFLERIGTGHFNDIHKYSPATRVLGDPRRPHNSVMKYFITFYYIPNLVCGHINGSRIEFRYSDPDFMAKLDEFMRRKKREALNYWKEIELNKIIIEGRL